MNEPVSIEAYLAQNGTLTCSNRGVSMLPLLRQGRDLFTVRKKGEERCRPAYAEEGEMTRRACAAGRSDS